MNEVVHDDVREEEFDLMLTNVIDINVMKILQIILNVLHVHYMREGPAMGAYRASVVKREASPLRYVLNRPSTLIIPCLVQMVRSHKLEGTWV